MARRTTKVEGEAPQAADAPAKVGARRSRGARPEPRREEFLAAACRRFARDGFAATSTRDICADLGIAHSAIYNYFRSKEEILGALEESAMLRAQSAIDALNESYAEEPALIRLEKMVRYVTEDALKNSDLWRVINEAERAFKPAQRRRAVERRDRFEARFRDAIAAAIKEGAIPPRDVQLATYNIIVVMVGPLRWYRPRGRLTARQIADDIWGFIRAALVAPSAGST